MTNEADLILGKKRPATMPTAQPNVNDWRCKQNLWGIMDAFKEEYPSLIMTARDKRNNYAAAREIEQIVGETNGPRFVHRAARHRRTSNLGVGSLYSLIQYRLIWFGGKADSDSEEARQRYVTGEYADFWEDTP